MNKNTDNRDKFENAIEVVLKATPQVLSPIVQTVTYEFTFKKWSYWALEESKSASVAFRRLLIEVVYVENKEPAEEDRIGIITLQALDENTTLFRVPPYSQWHFKAEPKTFPELGGQGYVRTRDFYWFAEESYFMKLLEALFIEFQRLAFIDFREKPLLCFKLPHREKHD